MPLSRHDSIDRDNIIRSRKNQWDAGRADSPQLQGDHIPVVHSSQFSQVFDIFYLHALQRRELSAPGGTLLSFE